MLCKDGFVQCVQYCANKSDSERIGWAILRLEPEVWLVTCDTIHIDQLVQERKHGISMYHFVIVAPPQEAYHVHTPLCIFKVVLLQPSDHLLEAVVHYTHSKVTILFFDCSKDYTDSF